MIEGSIVEQVDGFNEVGYYAAKVSCFFIKKLPVFPHLSLRTKDASHSV